MKTAELLKQANARKVEVKKGIEQQDSISYFLLGRLKELEWLIEQLEPPKTTPATVQFLGPVGFGQQDTKYEVEIETTEGGEDDG